MKRTSLACALLVLSACDPVIPQSPPPPEYVTARFDPSASPPVVPTPNDLATDPSTGLLNITPAPEATAADKQFYAYLNGLNGYPTTSGAAVTFSSALDPASVSPQSIRVQDLGNGPQVNVTISYTEPSGTAPAKVSIAAPAGGWTPGHTYALAVLGGSAGVRGAQGQQVIGSSAWLLIRSAKSLVTCADLASPDCRATTELIPSTKVDPAERVADQAAKAVQLEKLRLKYKPTLDSLGVPREQVALLWTFKVVDGPSIEFDPAARKLPTPTDLVFDPATGLVKIPIDPNSSAAQQEFTADYLNTLDGFPVSAAAKATVLGGDLDPATVKAATVPVIDLTAESDAGTAVTPAISYDATTHTIQVTPPQGGWPKGKRFAVAVLGGASGAKDLSGRPVVGSTTWGLVRSAASLVSCEDLTDPDCAPAITAAPLTTAQALGLEPLRRGYAPVLEALETMGIKRTSVAALWTFRVVSMGELSFDPAGGVVPFPNDLLRSPTTGKVNLPIPPGASPAQEALIRGLNTLDGFSTSAPAISENSNPRGALDIGSIDPATLGVGGTGFVKLTPGGNQPQVTVCLNCASSLLADGGTPEAPQQLQFVPRAPLDEKTPYAAYVTTEVRDESGKRVMAAPAFALLRMKAALVEGGKSTVSGVSDSQAAALEPVRQAFKPLLDGMAAAGLPRSKLALAWAFRTQSTVSLLKDLHGLPGGLLAGALSSSPSYVADISASVLPALPAPLKTNIGKVFTGAIQVPFLLTGTGGTLNPAAPQIQQISFLMTQPAAAAPSTGYPVVIVGHGLRGDRRTLLALANALAGAGYAAIATDVVFHGDRSTCVGVRAVVGAPSDDAACAVPADQMCDATSGRCLARDASKRSACDPNGAVPGDLVCLQIGQGRCLADLKCEGGDFLRDSSGGVAISGWNFLNTLNLFATRDNFRQQVVDLAQLARVLAGAGLNQKLVAAGGSAIDGARPSYAGISLGGILGTLYTAASPDLKHVMLNVPGADPAGILLTAPAFGPQRAGFLATLASQGMTQGSPGFDSFISIARWILDPADPQSAAFAMLNGTAPADRRVLVQYITGDQVVPNHTTEKLIAGANQPAAVRTVSVKLFDPSLTDLPLDSRHPFLANFANQAVTGQAQTQMVTFISTGVAP